MVIPADWISISVKTGNIKVCIIYSLRSRLNRRPFADDIFKCIFLNENEWISIIISLKFVAKGPINKIPALVQIMAWRRPGEKPLSEPMLISLPTHICVTRPQWVKWIVFLPKGIVNGFPATCQDVHKSGNDDGYYTLDPVLDGREPILVYCNMSSTPVTAGSFDGQVGITFCIDWDLTFSSQPRICFN